jgi:hypothetical protein
LVCHNQPDGCIVYCPSCILSNITFWEPDVFP